MKATIARIWRGRTARQRADEYLLELPESVQILRIVSSPT
jgi:hypothetical protein